jgi:hypothetical protein
MRNDHLISTGLQLHSKAFVVMPQDICRTMAAALSAIPDPSLEYGMYLKGDWDPKTCTVIVRPGEFYVPEQVVSGASIQFTEEPPGPEWNVVIHRHPPGVNRFSSTDENSINEEFLASVLFMPPWGFPDAVVNIPLAPGSKFQTRAVVNPEGTLLDMPEELTAKIKANVKRYTAPKVEKMGAGHVTTLGPDERASLQRELGESGLDFDNGGYGRPLPGVGTGKIGQARQVAGGGTIRALGYEPDKVRPRIQPIRGGKAKPGPLNGDAAGLVAAGFHASDIEDIADAQRESQMIRVQG